MPVHDWSSIEAGIFHHFHHSWIEEIQRALNAGVLPSDYYAMAEQHAAGFGPDVLTLQASEPIGSAEATEPESTSGGLLLVPPKLAVTAETDLEFYRRKQSSVVVRHVSGDRIVAVVEIVSPGNKSRRHALRSFIEKAGQLLDQGIHLLIIDVHPPGPRDPQGIHAEIWDDIAGQQYGLPAGRPLTLAAYESDLAIRCFVEAVAVGEALPDMPLFLAPNGQVPAPLERTYNAAFEALPLRWRRVLQR